MSIRQAKVRDPVLPLGLGAKPAGGEQLWQDGYRRGFAAGADVGRGQVLAEVKATQHGIHDALAPAAEYERARWMLRGEHRTRETFGRPHPDDFPGQSS
jgi:hypothetical protein